MNTATIPDCKTLVQLAADHPEKLEAINEFLKNIIVLVDLTGKAEQKKAHGFTVKTKKIRLLYNKGFDYFVTITDGKREACFLNHGNSVLTLADFADGTNANGRRSTHWTRTRLLAICSPVTLAVQPSPKAGGGFIPMNPVRS